MKLFDTINVCLFIEDIEEYIDLNKIKIDINESGNPYIRNASINIECEFNENIFNKALYSLKYEKMMYEYDNTLNSHTGRCYINKKDIVSDIILYVSKSNSYYDTCDLLKIIEFKNVMITSINIEENIINLTCDYYIRFNDFLEIEDKIYLENILRLININYSQSYNTPCYLDMPFDHTCTRTDENIEDWDDYNDDYDYDYDESQSNNEVNNLFDKSSKLVSKIFSSFYK